MSEELRAKWFGGIYQLSQPFPNIRVISMFGIAWVIEELEYPAALASSTQLLLPEFILHNANPHLADCPEREATYIITTGGINDPEKA